MLRILSFFNIFRLLLFFILSLLIFPFSNTRAIYFFLRVSGSSFIKLGQLLSTRPDLVGDKISHKLSLFQDKVPPFSCKKAHKIIKKEFKKKVKELFVEFSDKPVASASIAQVYKGKTINGDLVAIKILRPNIIKIINRDIFTLRILVSFVSVFSKYYSHKVKDILNTLEFCANHELDLLNEASACSQFKDNLADFDGIYVPQVYWDFSSPKVLVTQWINGIPFSSKDKIIQSDVCKIKAAENLVIGYFNQVYRDGFFHADMHPGNLFLMEDSRIAIVDFGIIGIVDKKTRIIIAQILMGFLNRDYLKVAKLHVQGDLVPSDINVEEFALNCRIIGESIAGKPVSEVSFANLLAKLLKMTKKYNMKTRSELLLLQKTIMLVEGVGVSLNKNLNIWSISTPWVKQWAKNNVGFDAKIRDCSIEFLEKMTTLPNLIEDSIRANNNSANLDKRLNKAQKEVSSWKFFTLIFMSLWIISIMSRYNIFN